MNKMRETTLKATVQYLDSECIIIGHGVCFSIKQIAGCGPRGRPQMKRERQEEKTRGKGIDSKSFDNICLCN